jgi:hypothetical protein
MSEPGEAGCKPIIILTVSKYVRQSTEDFVILHSKRAMKEAFTERRFFNISFYHIFMKLSDEAQVSLVTAICIVGLAVISKNVLHVQLDFVSLYGPVWIFIAYTISKDKARKSKTCSSPLFWSVTIILVTVAILVVYAI